MTPMLAEVSQGEIWMIILTGIMSVGTLVAAFKRTTDVRVQQPLDVQLVETLVSKDDFREAGRHNEEVHEQLFSKLNSISRTADDRIGSEITAVHNRVNAIEKSLGGLETSTVMQNQQLARMDAKIDRLIERK